MVSNTSKIPSTAQMNYCVLEPLIFQSKTQTSEGVDGAFECGEGFSQSTPKASTQKGQSKILPSRQLHKTRLGVLCGTRESWADDRARGTSHSHPTCHKTLSRSCHPSSATDCRKGTSGKAPAAPREVARTTGSGRLLHTSAFFIFHQSAGEGGFSCISSHLPKELFMEVAISTL